MGQRSQYSDYGTSWTIRIQISAGQGVFVSSKTSKFDLWANQHVIKIKACFFPGDEGEADLSPLFIASVNTWSCNSTFSYAFMKWPGNTSHFYTHSFEPVNLFMI